MIHLKKLFFRNFLMVALIGCLFCTFLYPFKAISQSSTLLVTGSNFNILIVQGSGIGFQEQGKYVLLNPILGDLNSSTNSLSIYEGKGLFRFLSNESLTLKITFDVSNVKVEGDQQNERRLIESETSINIDSSDTVIISWNIYIEPWLPIMFIFGMFGIASTIWGAMYTVQQIKKRNFNEGLTNGIIFITVGIGLVLAWLWG